MTTDIAKQVPQVIADPDSGELVDRADTSRVADLYSRLKVYMEQWREAKDWCRDALIEAADARSEWRWRDGATEVVVDPPSAATIEWDEDELRKLEFLLPPERYAELVQQVVVLKPQTVKLQALARQAGEDSDIAKIIRQAERRKPKNRYVRVSQ